MQMQDLNGKVAVITGASSSIGVAATEPLVEPLVKASRSSSL